MNKNFKAVQFEVTNRCNLNCDHCFKYNYGENGLEFNGFMTPETVDRFFDSGVEMICLLNFTGGEPLLNIDTIIYTLDKIIREKRVVAQIDIRTNGTILSELLINKLNEFSDYLYNDLYPNLKGFEEFSNGALWTDKENGYFNVNIQISVPFHRSDGQKAYNFYKERAKNVRVEIQDDNEHKMQKFNYKEPEKVNMKELYAVAFSGRAKKLKAEFFVDTPCHKVVFEGASDNMVKCPILIAYDGTISISAYCTHDISYGVGAMGSVYSDMTISEMIKDWNYNTPLTCKEACEIEKWKMWKETGHVEELYDFKETQKAIQEINKMLIRYKLITDIRKDFHRVYPNMTSEHIEELQKQMFELIDAGKYNEYEHKRLGVVADRINHEDLYVDFAAIHESYPYLSLDECKRMNELLITWDNYYNGNNGFEKDLKKADIYITEIDKLKRQNDIKQLAADIKNALAKSMDTKY